MKIRGFRIELGELEACLASHPGVAEAVVVVRTAEDGEQRLVAYVTGRPGVLLAGAALRAFLVERQPPHQVPAHYVVLDALPSTPSGKVDRRRLPDPPTADAARACVPPQTPVEHALAAVWRAVLRLENVGIEDDFFALGGDSILAIQVVARAREAGLRVTPRLLFDHPTIAALAPRTRGPKHPSSRKKRSSVRSR